VGLNQVKVARIAGLSRSCFPTKGLKMCWSAEERSDLSTQYHWFQYSDWL